MALRFDEYCFFHIPKCGGSYVRAVIKRTAKRVYEVGPGKKGRPYQAHCTPQMVQPPKKPAIYNCFTVVRHPLAWYESWYRYRFMTGWRDNHPVDKVAKSDTFEGFVEKMLINYPNGFVTDLMKPYTDTSECFQWLYQENLTNELRELLGHFGYEMVDTPKANVTNKAIKTELSNELRTQLLQAESRIIEHLNYDKKDFTKRPTKQRSC